MNTVHESRKLVSLLLVVAVLPTAGAAPDFTLREELGRPWTNECVTFALAPAQAAKAREERALLDSAGKPVPYQLVTAASGEPRLALLTDLTPFATRTWSFADSADTVAMPTDVQVEDTPDVLRLSNSRIGIALAKKAAPGIGPLAGIRLNSGKWIGGSRLPPGAVIRDWTVTVTQRGPVMAEALCRISFGDKDTWQLRVRLYAHEPVVLVDETFAADTPVTFSLVLSENFNPEQLLYRYGKGMPGGSIGKNATSSVSIGTVFEMEPWLHWSAAERRGSTFSVYNAQDRDLLTVAAREAGAWVDPRLPREKRVPPLVRVRRDDTGLHADFVFGHGQRKWLLGAFDRDAALAETRDPKLDYSSPLPYRYLVKHGHFPLDMIKDYVLRWPHALEHPRLLMTRNDVALFKARAGDSAAFRQRGQHYLNNPAALTAYNMDDAIPAYLVTEDTKLGDMLAAKATEMIQAMVDYLIDQNGLPFGAAPHHQSSLATAIGLADMMYDSPHLAPEMRERVRAQAAFLGYTLSRPEYWSPERGFAANPNMTTSVYGYRASLASFISDHPEAKQWNAAGLAELKSQLDTWSDANGGWLEAPHYAMVSYDQILGVLLMASNAGFNDWLYSDPKVKSVIRWFAKIDTPPDSRIGGFRHRPAIGNTYLNEPNGEYGILAYLFREKDPVFAAEMQWQFKQNNMYGTPGIGGFFPAFAGYRRILTDPTLPEKAPTYGSELFPQTGVVLRDTYPSARETYLHLIAGHNHAHYDHDSGSIVLYGKGRILADEFGYYGCTPEEDHSMLDSPLAGRGVMQVRDFATHPRFDYVAGVKQAWTRQIALVKGPTPESPTYFVINDALAVNGPATWRLWLTAAAVKLAPQSALVVGKEDVDLDVFFLAPPGLELKTEEKSRTSGSGMYPDWNWRGMTTTQTGLIAALPYAGGFRTVLFPRLKTEKPATCTALLGGKGVKVTHAAGTDYVFLANAPFAFDEGDLYFEGLAGVAQLRGDEVLLVLGSGGTLSARGKSITSDRPLPPTAHNLFPNGDFESGKPAPFAASESETMTVALREGNPVKGDTTHAGRFSLGITLIKDGRNSVGADFRVPVDPQKTYRVRLSAYADSKTVTTIGGYARDAADQQLKDAAGRVWQWSLAARGPMTGWQTLETTIGPAGSGAPLAWPAGITATTLTCWISGEPGTLYLDDISIEPVE